MEAVIFIGSMILALIIAVPWVLIALVPAIIVGCAVLLLMTRLIAKSQLPPVFKDLTDFADLLGTREFKTRWAQNSIFHQSMSPVRVNLWNDRRKFDSEWTQPRGRYLRRRGTRQ